MFAYLFFWINFILKFFTLNNTARGIIAETAMSVDMCYVEEMARISFPPYRTLDCRGAHGLPELIFLGVRCGLMTKF